MTGLLPDRLGIGIWLLLRLRLMAESGIEKNKNGHDSVFIFYYLITLLNKQIFFIYTDTNAYYQSERKKLTSYIKEFIKRCT